MFLESTVPLFVIIACTFFKKNIQFEFPGMGKCSNPTCFSLQQWFLVTRTSITSYYKMKISYFSAAIQNQSMVFLAKFHCLWLLVTHTKGLGMFPYHSSAPSNQNLSFLMMLKNQPFRFFSLGKIKNKSSSGRSQER